MPDDESKSAGTEEGADAAAPKLFRATRELREALTRLEQPNVPYDYFPNLDVEEEGNEGVMVFRAIDVYDLCDKLDAEYSEPSVTLTLSDHLDAAYDLAKSDQVKGQIKDVMEVLAIEESR